MSLLMNPGRRMMVTVSKLKDTRPGGCPLEEAGSRAYRRGNDDRRVGTGTRTETGTRRAALLGSVSLRAFALVVGYSCIRIRTSLGTWEPASLRALFPREVRLILGRPGTVGPSRAGTVALG